MLPIIGPTPDRGQSANIQQQDTESQDNPEETDEDKQSDKKTRGVKLDLGQSNEDGVHEKTAQMVLETSVKVSIKRSVTVSSNTGQQPDVSGRPTENVDPDETAKRIANFVDAMAGNNQSENPDAFAENVESAIDTGFQKARNEIGENPSDAIEQLFKDVRNALDEYLKVFSGDSAGQSGSSKATGPEAAVAEQNSAAQNAATDIPTNLGNQVSGTTPQTLTNLVGS